MAESESTTSSVHVKSVPERTRARVRLACATFVIVGALIGGGVWLASSVDLASPALATVEQSAAPETREEPDAGAPDDAKAAEDETAQPADETVDEPVADDRASDSDAVEPTDEKPSQDAPSQDDARDEAVAVERGQSYTKLDVAPESSSGSEAQRPETQSGQQSQRPQTQSYSQPQSQSQSQSQPQQTTLTTQSTPSSSTPQKTTPTVNPQPTTPQQPSQTTTPSESTQPTQPTQPSQPSQSVTPSEPAQPQASTEPEPVQPQTKTVSITVDGSAAGAASWSKTLTLSDGQTVYDVLMAADSNVNARSTGYGMYVGAIDGLAEKDHGSKSGWMYSVNGIYPNTACSNYVLKDGDVITWVYVNVDY